MAEEIVKYIVSVDFDTALKKLNDFNKKMGKFSSAQNTVARTKQKLDNQHFKERDKHLTKEYNQQVKREKDLSKAHVAAIKMNMKHDKKAATSGVPSTSTTGATADAHFKARQKHLEREFNSKLKYEKKLSRAHTAAIKENLKRDKSAIASRRNDILGRRDRIRASRSTNLASARTTFDRSSLALREPSGAGEAAAKQALLESVAKAKTANQVRMIVAKERERLRLNKQTERSLGKQNFLMQRMQSSSKQFAGNMLSAFAVAGLGVGIARVGQDFEAVNNTMLAVSTNAQEAGQNFKFVRDESYRLGLSLKDSGKNFAKMLSARGKMSLEDTKKAFTGISEMSTLLGLSAEESTRATNALQQIHGLAL